MRSISSSSASTPRERWEDIRAAVESVEHQRREPHEIILVVDHNPDLHLRLKREYPGAIVVENAQEKGLSGGKNTGAATASGDIVAFLDDDAIAEPGWLEALEEGFADPAVMGVGGLTRPLWAPGAAPLVPRRVRLDRGLHLSGHAHRTGADPQCHGRQRGLPQGGRSATSAGSTPASAAACRGASPGPLGCEETEFCIRLSPADAGLGAAVRDRAR